MNINEILRKIIDDKYNELGKQKNDKNNIFWQIQEFEGNAVGQIGEKFVKNIFLSLGIPVDNVEETIHNEYDILSDSRKIEIKTARKGKNNDTFQFNGINPIYNYDYLIFIGILSNEVVHKILSKDSIQYVHNEKKHVVNLGNNNKKLVAMNPGSTENYKLTLNLKDMQNSEFLIEEFKKKFIQ